MRALFDSFCSAPRRLGALVFCLLAACGGGETGGGPAGAGEELEAAVYTTFHPTTWMAERIASGRVPVVCPLPPGADPIFWQPDRETLARYAKARLIVVNGAGLEQWVETASLPPSRVVDTARGFEDEWLHYEEATTHSHGAAGEHTHAGLDGHTWLDPVLARRQADAMLAAMQAAFPDHAASFEEGHAALAAELDDLHARFGALAPALGAANVIASHPAYNYLARRYGFDVSNLDLDPDQGVGEAEASEILALVRSDAANLLLWEGEPADTARTDDAVRSILVSPAENPGEGEDDFLATMRANLDRLEAALVQ